MNLNKMAKDVNIDQQKAIYTKNKDILVSAPAGSGKTKILVNRMMEHLLNDGYSVDDFLVVTFTAAAALEMKQRLSKELDKHPELQEQKIKLPYAYITNFHGFCSTLLKKYGSLVGVPAGFEILEDPTLYKNEAYSICLERWIEEDEFQQFLSLYYPGTDLKGFFSQLMNLVETMHVIENKDTFLEDIIRENYDTCSSDMWPVTKLLQEYLKDVLEESKIAFNQLCEYASELGLEDFSVRPEKQGKASAQKMVPMEAYETFLDHLEHSIHVPYISYESLMDACNYKMPAAYSVSWKEIGLSSKSDEYKQFNKYKDKITKPFSDAYKNYYSENNEQLLEDSIKFLRMFLGHGGLVDQFVEVYASLKRRDRYLDFNDLEDYTIALLSDQLPIASLLQKQLKEVMVDEYQDTNGVQEKIIHLITDHSSIHIFMVGDIKQSIYRFRKADPAIFNGKYNRFAPFDKEEVPDQKEVRIDLHYNYRSNKIVLDSINYLFNMLMDDAIGDVKYLEEDNHQLNYDFYRKNDPEDQYDNDTRFDTELLLYEKSEEVAGDELEAILVAKRILDLVRYETVDNFSKQARPIDFKDIVVLTRTTKSLVTFKKVFDQFKIPGHIVLSDGFYRSVEVKAMLTILDALCNPYNDVAMLSMLRGNYVFSHFSDQQIYDLKEQYPDCKTIYERIQNDPQFNDFMMVFNELQAHLFDYPSDLLNLIYKKSEYPLFVDHLYNDQQRKANLELLLDYMFDHNHLTIPEIIHDLNQKIELGTDRSPAISFDENDNMVQFMTIHKSKGLEFPVVFVSNLDHGMNKMDSKQPVIIDSKKVYYPDIDRTIQNGMALKPRGKEILSDETNSYQVICEYMNPYHKILQHIVGQDSISEELRILYVALTRASQKLIMTGGCDIDYLNKIKDRAIYVGKYTKKDAFILPRGYRNQKSYLDWILLAYFMHPSIIQNFRYNAFDLNGVRSNIGYLAQENVRNTKLALKMYSMEEICNLDNYQLPSSKDEKVIYPIQLMKEVEDIEKTMAVTKLIDEVPYERVFTNKRKLSASEFGSLVHQFFEYFPLDKKDCKQVIEDYSKAGLWNEIEVEELNSYVTNMQAFIDSEVFTIMKNAKQLLREKEFSFQVENGMIIHGTFDVLCINEDSITIIDYKTDRIRSNLSEDGLKAIHKPQMTYYKEIIGKLYPDLKVEAIVFYLQTGQYVVL